MKNAKCKVERVKEDKDESFNANLDSNINQKEQYIMNQSYQFCERLRYGRLSFKGMNTYIENIMNHKKKEAEETTEAEKRGHSSSSESDIDPVDQTSEPDEEEEDHDDDFLGDLK